MASASLQKRPNDLFVSYAHADRARVDPIVAWLRLAGLKVWYDESNGDASQRNSTLLGKGLSSARGALFVLSSNWYASTWCTDEHEGALNERRESGGAYLLMAVRIDESEIQTWFKISQVLDLRTFDSAIATALLRSMSPTPPSRFDCKQDVYLAAPWSRQSEAVKPAIAALRSTQWRIVGDSPDLPHFESAESRIQSIILTARGLVAVLGFDASKLPHRCSPWILQEAEIAQRTGCPYLLFAEEGVTPPESLVAQSVGAQAISLAGTPAARPLIEALDNFDDEIMRRPYREARTFSFLATSLRGSASEMDELISGIQHASNIECVLGQRLAAEHAQRAIIDRIRNAAFVIADVSDGNRNSLIEAGSLKTRFMFQDREIHWYRTPLERIGTVYRLARAYRRRIL
jgi:hypothetical protein